MSTASMTPASSDLSARGGSSSSQTSDLDTTSASSNVEALATMEPTVGDKGSSHDHQQLDRFSNSGSLHGSASYHSTLRSPALTTAAAAPLAHLPSPPKADLPPLEFLVQERITQSSQATPASRLDGESSRRSRRRRRDVSAAPGPLPCKPSHEPAANFHALLPIASPPPPLLAATTTTSQTTGTAALCTPHNRSAHHTRTSKRSRPSSESDEVTQSPEEAAVAAHSGADDNNYSNSNGNGNGNGTSNSNETSDNETTTVAAPPPSPRSPTSLHPRILKTVTVAERMAETTMLLAARAANGLTWSSARLRGKTEEELSSSSTNPESNIDPSLSSSSSLGPNLGTSSGARQLEQRTKRKKKGAIVVVRPSTEGIEPLRAAWAGASGGMR